jgi:hypothetical protein
MKIAGWSFCYPGFMLFANYLPLVCDFENELQVVEEQKVLKGFFHDFGCTYVVFIDSFNSLPWVVSIGFTCFEKVSVFLNKGLKSEACGWHFYIQIQTWRLKLKLRMNKSTNYHRNFQHSARKKSNGWFWYRCLHLNSRIIFLIKIWVTSGVIFSWSTRFSCSRKRSFLFVESSLDSKCVSNVDVHIYTDILTIVFTNSQNKQMLFRDVSKNWFKAKYLPQFSSLHKQHNKTCRSLGLNSPYLHIHIVSEFCILLLDHLKPEETARNGL